MTKQLSDAEVKTMIAEVQRFWPSHVGVRQLLCVIESERAAQEEALRKIAAWLEGLETVLQREIQRTGDPELIARRGIYEGIAAEVLAGNWRHAHG